MAAMVTGEGEPSERGMVARLFAAFAVQVREIEARVRAGAEACIAEDMKLIQGLAKTLETLVTLDRRVAADAGVAAPDVEGLRAQVMERLRSLRLTRTAVAGAAPA